MHLFFVSRGSQIWRNQSWQFNAEKSLKITKQTTVPHRRTCNILPAGTQEERRSNNQQHQTHIQPSFYSALQVF